MHVSSVLCKEQVCLSTLTVTILVVQAHAEGVQVGRRELVQERHLKQRLEKMLDRKLTEQQAAADKEAAAAVQAAAYVASLEQFIQDLKVSIAA